MREGFIAGLRYWALIFALGFVLGVLRQTWLTPAIGPWWATVAELPLMLGASWGWCSRLVRRSGWPARTAPRRIMGATAFLLLMLAELALDRIFGQGDLIAFLRNWLQPAGALGLAGQLLYGLFPLWVARDAGRRA